MTIQITSPTHLPTPYVSAHVAESILSGRTISNDVAATIASWYGEKHPTMALLSNGGAIAYVDFEWAMLDIAFGEDLDEAEAICLDFLDEWATLAVSESSAA